jgi:hypothetical protein
LAFGFATVLSPQRRRDAEENAEKTGTGGLVGFLLLRIGELFRASDIVPVIEL